MATVSEGGAWGATWAGAKATHARALEYCMAMAPLRASASFTHECSALVGCSCYA